MKYEPEEWRRAYDGEGFVVVRDLLDPQTLSAARAALEGIVSNLDGLEPRLGEKIFLESQHVRNNPQWYAGVLTPEECGSCVRQVDGEDLGERVSVRCPAGSGVFFNTKILHAADLSSSAPVEGGRARRRKSPGAASRLVTPAREFDTVNARLVTLSEQPQPPRPYIAA